MAPGQVVDVEGSAAGVAQRIDALGERRGLASACSSARSPARLARGESGIADGLTRGLRDRRSIAKASAAHGRRRIEAAGLLGIGRNTLTRKVQDLKIDTKD
jgi:two-component system nitrogen regulation response regulator GlnG